MEPRMESKLWKFFRNVANPNGGKCSNENDDRANNGKDSNINQKYVKDRVNKRNPWKIILLNVRGLVTENSKLKAEYLGDHAKGNQVILMNITETWLNSTIKENV